MLNVILDTESRIALLEPKGALEQSDFKNIAALVDPFIEETGPLNGLIIRVDQFHGWDSFVAFASHMKFVRDHHREIKRIAFVTDSKIGDLAEKMADHFVAAEIKHFDFQALEAAKTWILS